MTEKELLNGSNQKHETRSQAGKDCRALFEDYKHEMEVQRFAELRMNTCSEASKITPPHM